MLEPFSAPAIEGGPAMSRSDGARAFGCKALYVRTIGGIQMASAAFFGWLAFLVLSQTADEMIRIAQNRFSFEGHTSKGVYFPALDLEVVADGTVLAVLSLCCLIGGYGLARLRPWARRWEIAY